MPVSPQPAARRAGWAAVLAAVMLSAIGLGGSAAAARDRRTRGSAPGARHQRARASRAHRLRFGIYPGGGAGTIGPGATARPEDPAKRLAALRELRGPDQLVLHLYANYTGRHGPSAEAEVGQEIGRYASERFEVELVLCYRPADGGSLRDVAGFARFVKGAVSSLGRNRRLGSLQITNEANAAGAADTTDGSYRHAPDALVAGVIAAQREIGELAISQIKIGFNWAYAADPAEATFWRYLHRHGGGAFVRAVDWVGLDAYPGTWGPPIDASDLRHGTATMMHAALHRLRRHYMPMAHLPRRVAIHISENGYPTGPGRTPAMQVTVMRASIATVEALHREYNITDYRWFDLRDAYSHGTSFENEYGLLYDNYAPKPALHVYRQLIARYGSR